MDDFERDWATMQSGGLTDADYDTLFGQIDTDFQGLYDNAAFDQDWATVLGGGLTDADKDRLIDQIAADFPTMQNAGMAVSGGRSIADIVNAAKNGSFDAKKLLETFDAKKLLETFGKAGIGLAGIKQALDNKPGSYTRASGGTTYQARELPQGAVKRAASGGLMSMVPQRFAAGGYTAQQIADVYKQTVGSGQMSEADFVSRAKSDFGLSDAQLLSARDLLLGGTTPAAPAPSQTLAQQIQNAQQQVSTQSGYTPVQMAEAGRGEGSPGFMQNDPEYMAKKQANDQLLIAGNMAGRTTPAGDAVFRSTAAYNPKTNLIELRDANGVVLTNIHPSTTGSEFNNLDRLGVNPDAYKSAVRDYLRQNPANAEFITGMVQQYQPRYGGAPSTDAVRSGIDPTQDASVFFSGALGKPNIREFMDKAGVDFQTASSLLYSSGLGSAADALVDWQKVMASADPARTLSATYAAIGTDPTLSQFASQAVGQDYSSWALDGLGGAGAVGGGSGPSSGASPGVATPPSAYPYNPKDIYNTAPAYGNIGDPGITPVTTSQSPMPMGPNEYTVPYEAVRYSSRLLPEGVRPGAAWNRGGGQVTYTRAASGGLMGLPKGDLGRYAGGGLGRLVQGPGDGVSDSIPASIDGEQPALIAQGEYVLPARVVSELGNGSTEAGAARLDQLVARIEQLGKSAGRGKDSGAHTLLG